MSSSTIKIVSGGQTGIDRVALDAAIESGLDHGGWCPKGRLAEDGIIPERYQLQETTSKNYAVRTEKNVEDSDGTLILFDGQISGGTALTARLAAKHGKPCLQIDFARVDRSQGFEYEITEIRDWIQANSIRVLNVAGPRESNAPELSSNVFPFLIALFGPD